MYAYARVVFDHYSFNWTIIYLDLIYNLADITTPQYNAKFVLLKFIVYFAYLPLRCIYLTSTLYLTYLYAVANLPLRCT